MRPSQTIDAQGERKIASVAYFWFWFEKGKLLCPRHFVAVCPSQNLDSQGERKTVSAAYFRCWAEKAKIHCPWKCVIVPCLNCDVVTLTSVKSVDLQKDRMDSLHHWHTCVYFCVKTLFAGALPQSSSLPADAAEERGGGYDSRDGLVRLHAELAVWPQPFPHASRLSGGHPGHPHHRRVQVLGGSGQSDCTESHAYRQDNHS